MVTDPVAKKRVIKGCHEELYVHKSSNLEEMVSRKLQSTKITQPS